MRMEGVKTETQNPVKQNSTPKNLNQIKPPHKLEPEQIRKSNSYRQNMVSEYL